MSIQEFIDKYTGKGYEKGEMQIFWLDLLATLFGITDATDKIIFEKSLSEYGAKGFIDAYLPETKVLIEQKSSQIDLTKAAPQSDGSLMTPYEQARRYASYLNPDETPRWIITCNFREIFIYNQNQKTLPPEKILLSELTQPSVISRLSILVNPDAVFHSKEEEISKEACMKVRLLYDVLEKQYKKQFKDEDYDEDLNVLCIRLVFLFYAEDELLFGGFTTGKFDEFVRGCSSPAIVRRSLISLFDTLNQKTEERDPCNTDLNAFPYVNGGLFADKSIHIPEFNADIVRIIEHDCGAMFDWSGISPTIFGALFESILNPETRSENGMHYTAPENIHKAIAPLFLDALIDEFEDIKKMPNELKRIEVLRNFQDKIASLTFLDPACGSGNFLTETYISLRKLENEILAITGDDEIKVSISNFYGIEIHSFAATIAKTAMWIAESQQKKETSKVTKTKYEFFPLQTFANVVHGNALKLEWDTLRARPNLFDDHLIDNGLETDPRVYDYIIGNPPFYGASNMTTEQKKEVVSIIGKQTKLSNSVDMVAAWYHIAARKVLGKKTRCAFVSTNSICQGEQVKPVWYDLFNKYKLTIDFAYRPFKWESESDNMAHVHCVIIGFHCGEPSEKRYFIDGEKNKTEAKNINAYLIDAPNVFVESRATPICDVPRATKGNQPTDNGNLILTESEKTELIKLHPSLKKWIKQYMGSVEYINSKLRYCFWLKDARPEDIKRNKEILQRVTNVRNFRLKSSAKPTVVKAEHPHLFFSLTQPNCNYIAIPRVSSERRDYIPIGILPPDIIASDALTIIPSDSLSLLAILTSRVHMAWMRAIGGRLEISYRYSGSVVYNNFIWVELTDKDKKKLEQTAQAILDVRALYPESSLATLYDSVLMPKELRKAHKANDKLVMKLYGFDAKATEEEIVARLMEMYMNKVGK